MDYELHIHAFLSWYIHSSLATTPILILANKIDLDPHISESDLIRGDYSQSVSLDMWIVITLVLIKFPPASLSSHDRRIKLRLRGGQSMVSNSMFCSENY